MDTIKALQNLGLSEKESKVYIALLELGKANVTRIAQLSKLKRPTVYLLLEELRKKQLVLKVPHAKNAIFIAQDPDAFFQESFNRAKEAHSTLSQLKALHRKDSKVSSMYFEGEEGVREALFYKHKEIANKEVVGFFAKGETLTPRLLKVCHEWRETMKKSGATLRGIAPDHSSLQEFRDTDNQLNQIFKTIPFQQYSSDVSIDATSLFVRIVLFSAKQAIIIENPQIVKTVQQIFELSWKNLK
jgi:hypothetical protein